MLYTTDSKNDRGIQQQKHCFLGLNPDLLRESKMAGDSLPCHPADLNTQPGWGGPGLNRLLDLRPFLALGFENRCLVALRSETAQI